MVGIALNRWDGGHRVLGGRHTSPDVHHAPNLASLVGVYPNAEGRNNPEVVSLEPEGFNKEAIDADIAAGCGGCLASKLDTCPMP